MSQEYRRHLKEVGSRLREIRKSLDLTLENLQKITGFSTSILSDVENGKKSPSTIYLYGLATLYKANLNYVFTGKGSPFLDKKAHFIRDYGKDKERMADLLSLLQHSKIVRSKILADFQKFLKEDSDLLNWEKEEKQTKSPTPQPE